MSKQLNSPAPPPAASPYKSVRSRAWRNSLVSCINAALEQGLITLEPDNGPTEPVIFEFLFAECPTVPALGFIRHCGFNELSVHCAICPTPGAERFIACFNAGFACGEVFATGWLERETGPYLMTSHPFLHCRRGRLRLIASAIVPPRGFADSGRFFCEPVMNDDPVNHPRHYNAHPSGIECITITRHMSFNVGSALKYLWRAGLKGDAVTDLRKAVWYLEDEIARLSGSRPRRRRRRS